MDQLESRFAVFRLLYVSGYSVSTRERICCFLDIVHMLEWTAYLCKLSEYLYTDILC